MKKFDVFAFKKLIAVELFEHTLTGAWLTIVGFMVMGLLFLSELQAYLAVTVLSEVAMEPPSTAPGGDLLRLNFDVALPYISCQYITVDLDDVLGRRKLNFTSSHIFKFRID